MKKYNVENLFANAEQIAGYKPRNEIYDNFVGDYTEATSKEEAIAIAIDYLVDQMCQNKTDEFDIEKTDDSIKIFKFGELIGEYYNFKAKLLINDIKTLDAVKELDGETLTPDEFEELYENDFVKTCMDCGSSGLHYDCSWSVFTLTDDTEISIYVRYGAE